MNDDAPTCTLAALHLHPVKSCAGLAPAQALVIETGLDLDRAWMVIDEAGVMVTQRDLPRLALVRPTLRGSDMVLRAPGMLALHIALDTVEEPTRARVWNDEVQAYSMGSLAAQWFSDFLGRRLRLARIDPDTRRLASARWTGGLEAKTAFSDGFPLLVASTASLTELNRRLTAAGQAAVPMERFRPNIVIDGLADAHGEDHIETLTIDSPDGAVVLKLVKPCSRCSIPDVDPATAETGHAVTDALATYRADPRLDGALTFGQNAVIVSGIDCRIAVGARVRAALAF